MASHPVTKLTEEQYLSIERAADFKSDYFRGEMFAMSGASMQHVRLQGNLFTQLSSALLGGRCEAFGSDLRVRVSSSMYTYPDISVVCGKPALADDYQDVLLNPVVIFEVLSPSTERYDRGLKRQRYRAIATLQDYVLVSQSEVRVEQYTRQENNLWVVRDYETLDDVLTIASISVSLPMRAIYNRVEFPALSEPRP
jgi:Uma2 family endonuclease